MLHFLKLTPPIAKLMYRGKQYGHRLTERQILSMQNSVPVYGLDVAHKGSERTHFKNG